VVAGRFHVESMLQRCRRGQTVQKQLLMKDIPSISYMVQGQRPGREHNMEMEEVESKLHLFGCQQKDLANFFKVRCDSKCKIQKNQDKY
jgi:hypothetical protein